MTLREVTLGNLGLMIFFAGFLAILSVKVGFDGWALVYEMCVMLLMSNAILSVAIIAINRPILLFYIKDVVLNVALAVVSFYIVVVETMPERPLLFVVCLTCVTAFYALSIFSYINNKKAQMTPKKKLGFAKPYWFGIAGSLGASFQIVSSDNGILLLIATISGIFYSLMATICLRLAFKRRWGKAAGAWNEV